MGKRISAAPLMGSVSSLPSQATVNVSVPVESRRAVNVSVPVETLPPEKPSQPVTSRGVGPTITSVPSDGSHQWPSVTVSVTQSAAGTGAVVDDAYGPRVTPNPSLGLSGAEDSCGPRVTANPSPAFFGVAHRLK